MDYTNADGDLLVTDRNGLEVYVDASAITAGFNDTVDIESTGNLSINGGATTTPITFSSNDVVTDSVAGGVVNIDSSGITRVGTDSMEFPGTNDVFNAVIALRDELLNTRNRSASEHAAALDRRLGDIERVQSHVLDILGVQSVSLQQIDRLQTRTEDLQLNEKIQYGNTVSADVAESVTRLQELTNLQQFTLAAVSKYLTPNLLNYLQ